MDARIERNKQYLADLFAGQFRGHAIVADPEMSPPDWAGGDFVCVDKPFDYWGTYLTRAYEAMAARSEQLGDDNVPYVKLLTGTQLFAQAFGAPVHAFEDSPPCALPLVHSAQEADRLDTPGLDTPCVERVFAMADYVADRVGPDVPIGVPDIQSPFDIAALIWNKEDLFIAMHTDPDAVKRLIGKCNDLLRSFVQEFKRQFPNCNLCHCPIAWAPPDTGIWLSEDEVGSMSAPMFEEFCLPTLTELSDGFGGIYIHCCATADHQYPGFNRIPNLRGLNRVFQEPGPAPAITAFENRTVLINAWFDEQAMHSILDMGLPKSRFLFDIPAMPLDDAKRAYGRLRERCPRRPRPVLEWKPN